MKKRPLGVSACQVFNRFFFSTAFVVLVGCESKEIVSSKQEIPDAPSVLTSTDDMRSGSGALGDRVLLPGRPLYESQCASCHEGGVYKAPHKVWLELMSSRTLYNAMTEGIMAPQSKGLSDLEKREVVEYLTLEPFDESQLSPEYQYCQEVGKLAGAYNPKELVGWGHDTSRFVPPEIAGFASEEAKRLKLKWSFGYPGALRARSQPTIAMRTIFTGSQDGTVYALDLETGCVRWAFGASAEVRTGIVLGEVENGRKLAFFGDLIANAYAVDAITGELVWKIRTDGHSSATLTGTPAFYDNKLFIPISSLEVTAAADTSYDCCTFRGSVLAVNAENGERDWQSFSIPQVATEVGKTSAGARILSPSGVPVWSSPTVDTVNNMLIFGTGENYSTPADGNSDAIVAVDLNTGERLWHRQIFAGDAWNVACMFAGNPNCPEENGPDFDQGSSPLLVDLANGDRIIVAGHKDGRVIGYDVNSTSPPRWEIKLGRGSIQGGVHWGMAAVGATIYAPINDMNDTQNGDFLDPTLARPGIAAVDANSGEVLWQHVQEDVCDPGIRFCDPGISAPVTAISDAVIAGHLDGFVRIYEEATGEVIWEFDTTQDLQTVNGVQARGASISGAGPAVGHGHMVINSGYGLYSHEPGNALLVFSIDGE
ncbi:MAG: PQQ-binding-like beta-propeller repeat protein [Halieaceae bacterium]|nr:PQQ-binding-like beta-propeller repeat protein [Halieaceae bacterium]